jgi:hypothetical protein
MSSLSALWPSPPSAVILCAYPTGPRSSPNKHLLPPSSSCSLPVNHHFSTSKMDARDPQTPITPPRPLRPLQSNSPKTQYLIIYNSASALLWLVVLGRVLALVPLFGFAKVYWGTGDFAKWTQTLALLEVAHAALGELRLAPFPSRPGSGANHGIGRDVR